MFVCHNRIVNEKYLLLTGEEGFCLLDIIGMVDVEYFGEYPSRQLTTVGQQGTLEIAHAAFATFHAAIKCFDG